MERLNYFSLSAGAFKHVAGLDAYCKESTVPTVITRLVQIYASQLNGCAFCVDIHSKEAKISGERELRIYHVPVWRESPLFTEQEKAALEWTRAVTQLSAESVSDALFEKMKRHFTEKEISDLTMQVAFINLFNRIAVPFRSVPGSRDKALGLEKANLA